MALSLRALVVLATLDFAAALVHSQPDVIPARAAETSAGTWYVPGVDIEIYSQLGQDHNVASFYAMKRGGYFVEVGAYNGIEFSNTYMLERSLGWRGVCVEPLPGAFATLRAGRRCNAYNVAADEFGGCVLSFVVGDMFSGDVSRLNAHRHILDMGLERINVTTRTLTDMLDEAGAPPFIEFLSVDTEGSELDVLAGVDWGKYTFGWVSVEHNFQEPHRSDLRAFLFGKGYKLLGANQWDDDYVLHLR